MCLAAAQHVIDKQRYAELAIPPEAVPLIEWAWNQEPPALYGRFDIAWAGAASGQAPKLLEYNADTPTSLLEAAVIQWSWLEDRLRGLPGASFFTKADQFNSIHERLIAKWKDVAELPDAAGVLCGAGVRRAGPEDCQGGRGRQPDGNVSARHRGAGRAADAASLRCRMSAGTPDRLCFVDMEPSENQILTLFKLYPWEAMLHEEFGPHALEVYRSMTWIEPIWKMLLSNKGILPILWQLYPGHELLLPAYFENHGDRGDLGAYVRKPLHSREGANIAIVQPNAATIETPGMYGDGPFIRQAIAPGAVFNNHLGEPRYPVLGLWMVDQDCSRDGDSGVCGTDYG